MFARAGSEERLVELLAYAEREGAAVGVVGSGSNLLVSDDGFRGLVLKLDGDLARIERDGERLLCGAGVRLPSAAAKSAGWGLTGLEFGVNIPGTVGGAVRMNANAYGGELARTLDWVDCLHGLRQRATHARLSSASPTGTRTSATTRSSRAPSSRSPRPTRRRSRRRWPGCARSAARRSRPGIKTFGSTFKNPDDPRAEGRSSGQLLDAAGCRGLRVGGASFSAKHANFVENDGSATTADILALMAEGRRRVHDLTGVVLEPEVQILGEVEWPAGWDLGG